MTADGALRFAPRLTLLLMAVPVIAGLAGTLRPAFEAGSVARLLDWPGLPRAMALSMGTGIASTVLALALTLGLVAALQGGRLFTLILRLLSPLLAVPHAAAALGLAFLLAPSGWIARALSPWATGWTQPPDLLILNDPAGLALTAGLVLKEVPFLLLILIAALPQADAPRRLMLMASLGYGRVAGWMLSVLPAVWPQMRPAVYAVLAYSMTAVDMAIVLGPALPPTLSAQLVLWMTSPDLSIHPVAAAGALVQLGLVLAALALLRGAETGLARLGCRLALTGIRGIRADRWLAPVVGGAGLLVVLLMAGSLAGLALWSFAGPWVFPDAWPQHLELDAWARAAPGLGPAALETLLLAALSTALATGLVLSCLEAEARFGLKPGGGALWLLWLPLIMPQVAFLPGLAELALRTGAEGSTGAVAAAHLVFVLPYVFLSLAAPWRAWDPRLAVAGAALGATPGRIFWRLRLPMLLRPILTAAAVGFAVSVGQYLPTLLIGGGRVTTLTTEAVALSSGGNRRIIGTYAMLQLALPLLAFALALALPAALFRNRTGMRPGA
ncbi:MAG: ABC transporter permease subunit [Rhodobacter sp.]|nr:ABC transporter permease subunit [Rhodobacter sp.]